MDAPEFLDCTCLHATRCMGNVPDDDCPYCHGYGELNPPFHVVVLGVDAEPTLLEVAARLDFCSLPHVLIREPDAPYHGAATAIGVLPICDRRDVRPVLSHLKLYGG